MSEDKFDEQKFMSALVKLKDTQESIQGRYQGRFQRGAEVYKGAG